MRVRASVVVPTSGRPDLLGHCLRALACQDLNPAAYEIIVVDDAGSEVTRRQVERCADEGMAIRYLRTCKVRGPAAARNLGWHAARGEIIAFTDDDCVPEPSWLRAGIAAFVDGVAGVSGQTIVLERHRPTDYEHNAARLAHSEFVTANCFYRREALVAAGGFDERFALPWREDTDVYFSLIARNARLVREPQARVVHEVRSSLWGASLRQQRKSEFNALLYKKHPQLYRSRIQAAPPLRYYLIDLLLLTWLLSVLTRRQRPAVYSAALWMLLTARFSLQRLVNTSKSPVHVAEMIVTSMLIPPLATFWRMRGAVRFRVPFF